MYLQILAESTRNQVIELRMFRFIADYLMYRLGFPQPEQGSIRGYAPSTLGEVHLQLSFLEKTKDKHFSACFNE